LGAIPNTFHPSLLTTGAWRRVCMSKPAPLFSEGTRYADKIIGHGTQPI
jgi:hypothetical protein